MEMGCKKRTSRNCEVVAQKSHRRLYRVCYGPRCSRWSLRNCEILTQQSYRKLYRMNYDFESVNLDIAHSIEITQKGCKQFRRCVPRSRLQTRDQTKQLDACIIVRMRRDREILILKSLPLDSRSLPSQTTLHS